MPTLLMPIYTNLIDMYIYKITNKINGKTYIGQTSRPFEIRFYEHLKYIRSSKSKANCPKLSRAIKKYGAENFDAEVIDTAKDIEELNSKEVKWISFYDSVKNGYNLKCGGENKQTSEETRNKLSKVGKSKKLSKEHIEKISQCTRIIVYQYDLEGFFIKEWESATEAARKIKTCQNTEISKCCKLKRRQAGGFFWRYQKLEKIEIVLKKTTWPSNKKYRKGKRVCTVDLNGNIIKEYSSLLQAAEENKCDKSTIYKVCKGIFRNTKGIIFRYI